MSTNVPEVEYIRRELTNATCSFQLQDCLHRYDRTFPREHFETVGRPISRAPKYSYRPPTMQAKSFQTAVRVDGTYELKTSAARTNDAIRTAYRPPSSHDFRLASPPTSWANEGIDFVAKFVVPSNQDLRRSTAIDQEKFWLDEDPNAPVATMKEMEERVLTRPTTKRSRMAKRSSI